MDNIYDWLKKYDIDLTLNPIMETALTHSSYVNENRDVHEDNERLEFMGDAVLQIYSSTKLFYVEPILSEGRMTLFRSKLVNEQALATYVRDLNISKYLNLGIGEDKSGGRNRDSILADMFEAFIGALYLIKGHEEVFKLLDKIVLPYFELTDLEHLEDFKTRLQEFVQSDTRKTVTYEIISTSGPSNAPTFEVCVKLENIILAQGKGSSKKRAEQEAAKNALLKLAR